MIERQVKKTLNVFLVPVSGCALLILCLLGLQPASAEDKVNGSGDTTTVLNPVRIEQPDRAFGYVLGDKLVQRIQVAALPDEKLLLEQLPLQRTGPWLERQFVKFDTGPGDQHWIEIGFQIVNVPTSLITTSLPEIALTLNPGESTLASAWPITIGPLTPEQVSGEGELLTLRPDRSVKGQDTLALTRQLRISAGILGLLLLLWAAWWWWRERRDVIRLPFANAQHQLRKLGVNDSNNDADAWVVLHQAFNDSAGRTLQARLIPEYIQHTPWLKPLQASIEGFFSASSARFFEQPARACEFSLHDLCRDLYLAEKKHAA